MRGNICARSGTVTFWLTIVHRRVNVRRADVVLSLVPEFYPWIARQDLPKECDFIADRRSGSVRVARRNVNHALHEQGLRLFDLVSGLVGLGRVHALLPDIVHTAQLHENERRREVLIYHFADAFHHLTFRAGGRGLHRTRPHRAATAVYGRPTLPPTDPA
jgi:hypothetical protein